MVFGICCHMIDSLGKAIIPTILNSLVFLSGLCFAIFDGSGDKYLIGILICLVSVCGFFLICLFVDPNHNSKWLETDIIVKAKEKRRSRFPLGRKKKRSSSRSQKNTNNQNIWKKLKPKNLKTALVGNSTSSSDSHQPHQLHPLCPALEKEPCCIKIEDDGTYVLEDRVTTL